MVLLFFIQTHIEMLFMKIEEVERDHDDDESLKILYRLTNFLSLFRFSIEVEAIGSIAISHDSKAKKHTFAVFSENRQTDRKTIFWPVAITIVRNAHL